MDGDNSPLTSLCMVRAAELFPKPDPEREDESLHVQFKLCKFVELRPEKLFIFTII